MVHLVVVTIVAVTLSFHFFQYTNVRAEDFGKKSLLYQAMVEPDAFERIEEIRAKQIPVSPLRYNNSYTVFLNEQIERQNLQKLSELVRSTDIAQIDNSSSRTQVIIHEVLEGDTLIGIAKEYGLNLSTVLWANNLTVKSTIRPGQSIKILPTDGILYVVKKGDTISEIAKNFQAEGEKIIAYNSLKDANALKINQELLVPGGEMPAPVIQRPTSFAKALQTPPSRSSSQISSSSSSKWVWPTDWRVITQYYGWKHTGLDVDGDLRTNNYAAADGIVTYTGWRNGYGLTVEMDHGNGVKTRYAHFSKISVNIGDVLSAGDILGKTGTTGRSTGTHLHFEIIINGKFKNPLDYIR